jgi:ELWxxDGT repeat protein
MGHKPAQSWSSSNSGLSPNTNPAGQTQVTVNQPVVIGGEMYFQANDGNGINELWKSDGTTNGTSLVKSFNADTTQSEPDYFVNFNGTLYFVANGKAGFVEGTSATGPQIWKSDGTAIGTVQVTNIAASGTPNPQDGPADPFFLTVAGSNLFFVWYNGNDNDITSKEQQLYVVNNANPGGLQLTTIAVGEPQNLTNANGELYFTMNDGTHGQELWKSGPLAALRWSMILPPVAAATMPPVPIRPI